MILYIAGKYRGDIDANIAAARKVAIELWEAGFTVICPHLNTAHFERDCSIPEDNYIKGDLHILSRCDAVIMLEGWQQSEGAMIEHMMAKEWGIPVYYYPDIGGV